MTGTRFNFTKATINALSTKKRVLYRDDQVRGLSLLVTVNGAKTFYVVKKIRKKTEYICLGKYPDLSIENARGKAKVKLAQIVEGINPNEEARSVRNEMTFGDLFKQYMERHSKLYKKSWRYDEREVTRFLSDWFNTKISDITRNDVRRRLEKIYAENGLYQSNHILGRIRAIYNKAIEWDWEGKNPAIGIKKHKVQSRERFVLPYEMPHLLQAIEDDHSSTARDFFYMLLLTGVRKSNAYKMRWEEIIWEEELWSIPETKNGDPQSVTLNTRAIEILRRREMTACSEWVFPQEKDPCLHYSDSSRAWERTRARATLYYWRTNKHIGHLVEEELHQLNYGVMPQAIMENVKTSAMEQNLRIPRDLIDIRLHDLRRTLGSYQAITGSSLQIIGKSLGHKSMQATQIYARLNMEPVRQSVNKATDMMFGV